MTGDFTLEIEHGAGFALGRLQGELTLGNAAQLYRRLEPELVAGGTLVLDLSELEFLDSAGIHCLFRLARALTQRGGELRLVVPPGAPSHRILQIVDPSGYIPMHPTAAEATAG